MLVCKNSPPFYAGQDLSNPHFGIDAFLRTGQDGKLHIVTNPDHPALIERLKDGHVPAWLKQVELPATNDYLLYKVKKNEIQK